MASGSAVGRHHPMSRLTIIGHRGAAGHAPENTLLSFKKAIELGCQAVEMDVHLSKDGEVVVIHDSKVDRVTGMNGKVKKMTLAELKKLYCPMHQCLPTLQEVIDLCRGRIRMFIELKAKGTPDAVAKIIAANKIEHEVVILSFKIGLLKRIKRLNSKLKVIYLFYRKPLRLWHRVKSVPLDYIGTRLKVATAKLVRRAHQLRRRVYIYDVNDVMAGLKLKNWKVDAICTDYPILFTKPRRR